MVMVKVDDVMLKLKVRGYGEWMSNGENSGREWREDSRRNSGKTRREAMKNGGNIYWREESLAIWREDKK